MGAITKWKTNKIMGEAAVRKEAQGRHFLETLV